MKYYNLYINTKNDETYINVTNILGIEPTIFDVSKQEDFETWTYQLKEKEQNKPINFINVFLNILEPNFIKLKKIGIDKTDILFWLVYEYEHQCSMEFHPEEMIRLGKSNIVLNIDCFDKTNLKK